MDLRTRRTLILIGLALYVYAYWGWWRRPLVYEDVIMWHQAWSLHWDQLIKPSDYWWPSAVNHFLLDLPASIGWAHTVGVLLHAVVAWMVYHVSVRLGVVSRSAAVIAAVLVLVHPLATEVVASINYQSELFGALAFLLAAFGISRLPHWSGPLWICLGAWSLPAAKTADVMGIVLIGALCWRWRVRVGATMWPLRLLMISGLGLWLTTVLTGFHLGTSAFAMVRGDASVQSTFPPAYGHLGYASMQACMALHDVRVFLLPVRQVVAGTCEMTWPPATLGALLMVLGTVGVALVAWGRGSRSWLVLAVLATAVWWLPRFVVPTREYLTEHHAYLPMIGWCLVVGVRLDRWMTPRRFPSTGTGAGACL